MSIQVNEKVINTDEHGFLCDPSEWEPAVAETMAKIDGIVLTDLHWEVLRFLRNYYEEYQMAPDFRVIAKSLSRLPGAKSRVRNGSLHRSLGYPTNAACRYAGFPKPVKWTRVQVATDCV